jgi:pilus assembly protein CpaB
MRFVFFLVAAVVAIVVGVVVLRFNETPPPPPAVVQSEPPKDVGIKTVDVLVAKVDVPVGTVIDSTMVDTQPWPEHLVLDSFISVPADGGAGAGVLGKVARSSIQAREPFIRSKLADPNDPGFISASLPSGMRAITLPVDAISGVAGYVFPGDHVDVLFSHSASIGEQSGSGRASVSEVVAANVRVLAVGGRESSTPSSDGSGPASSGSAASSVTLEVSDENVQRIRLAEKNGNLSLSLRSIRDDNSSSPSPTTLVDITKVGGGAGLIVVRGPGSSGGKITSSEGLSSESDSGGSGAARK